MVKMKEIEINMQCGNKLGISHLLPYDTTDLVDATIINGMMLACTHDYRLVIASVVSNLI